MKVLFVYSVSESLSPPHKPIAEFIEISFSVAYLSAAVRRAGHEPSLVVLRHGGFKKQMARALEKEQPDMVCYTAVATEYTFVENIAKWVQEQRPGIYQVVGGTHPTLCPDECITGPFQAVCVGEGEAALSDLADALGRGEEPAEIGGLWFQREGEEPEKNDAREFEQGLDELAVPDRLVWRDWIEDPRKHTILIARGCPFPCTYCSNRALSKVAEGKFVRFRSIDSVIAELEQICEEFPETEYCYFEVETITSNRKWAFEFAEKLEEYNAKREKSGEKKLEFATNYRTHPKVRFPDFFAALKKANFSYLRIGIESGSERIRRDILKRYESNEDLLNTFEDVQNNGMKVFAYNLVGIPGETPEDFMETVRINREPVIARSYIGIFFPYPGTELATVCKERGIVIPKLADCAERFRARLGLPEFPDREVERYFRDFQYLVGGEQAGLFERVDSYVWATLRGYPALHRAASRLRGTGVLAGARRAATTLRAVLPGRSRAGL